MPIQILKQLIHPRLLIVHANTLLLLLRRHRTAGSIVLVLQLLQLLKFALILAVLLAELLDNVRRHERLRLAEHRRLELEPFRLRSARLDGRRLLLRNRFQDALLERSDGTNVCPRSRGGWNKSKADGGVGGRCWQRWRLRRRGQRLHATLQPSLLFRELEFVHHRALLLPCLLARKTLLLCVRDRQRDALLVREDGALLERVREGWHKNSPSRGCRVRSVTVFRRRGGHYLSATIHPQGQRNALALRARQDLVELPRRFEEDQSTGERLDVADACITTLQSMRVRRMEPQAAARLSRVPSDVQIEQNRDLSLIVRLVCIAIEMRHVVSAALRRVARDLNCTR